MAGDWIKMRVGLPADPHVVRIVSALNANKHVRNGANKEMTKLCTVGALHAMWGVFDQYSNDGKLDYTPAEMDAQIGWDGFTAAVISAGWMEFDGSNTLKMHNFEVHNGKSAKRRASESKRMQIVRSDAHKDVRMGANDLRTREEKRRLNPKSKAKEGASRFTPPTLAEVASYIEQRKSSTDPSRFVDFYTSKGWRVGNQPMKDWRAAVRTWEQREEVRQGAAVSSNGNPACPKCKGTGLQPSKLQPGRYVDCECVVRV